MSEKIFITALLISLIASGLMGRVMKESTLLDDGTGSAPNPIKTELDTFANQHQLDLSSFDSIRYGRFYQPEDLLSLSTKPKSLDVLIFGDSSVMMGLIPEVVKQSTGLNIGYFHYPALTVNESLFNLIEYTTAHLLKEQGVVIFMFNRNFWSKGFYTQQENQTLEEIVQNPQLHFTLDTTDCLFCPQTQLAYTEAINSSSRSIPFIGSLEPLSVPFYNLFLEQHISPKAYKRRLKNKKQDGEHAHFLIEPNTVFIYKKNAVEISKRQQPESLGPLKSNHLTKIAEAMTRIKHPVVVALPLTTEDSMFVFFQQLQQQYFSKHLLMDMNALLPPDWIVDAKNRTHLANLGAFQQSLLMAKWLKRYFQKESTQTLNRVVSFD